MKKLVAALLAAAAISGLCTASADAAPGTASDPLISRSFADGEVYRSLTEAARLKLGSALENAMEERLAAAGVDGVGGVVTSLSWSRVAVAAGGSLEALTGAEFALASGSVTVEPEGFVLDLSSGRELEGTEALKSGVKYFAAEDTTALLRAGSDAILYIIGRYRPLEGVSAGKVYSDVSDTSAWYYRDVGWAQERGLFYGADGEFFRPHDDAARADVVYALWAAAGSPEPLNAAGFSDMEEDGWYAKAIAWAQENGIVNGYPDGRFGVGDSIIREQIAAVFMRYAAYLGRDTSGRADLTGYGDYAELSEWAREYMQWANAEGLINGIGNNLLGAQGTTTRSQIAALLRRLSGE